MRWLGKINPSGWQKFFWNLAENDKEMMIYHFQQRKILKYFVAFARDISFPLFGDHEIDVFNGDKSHQQIISSLQNQKS